MHSAITNFKLPPAAFMRFASVRKSTGLSHAANLSWGLKQWVAFTGSVDTINFSKETPGRKQKVLKLPAEAIHHLKMVRDKTGLPLWKVADGALFFCETCRPPAALDLSLNKHLAGFGDEELRLELIRRGYRVEKA